MTLVDETYLKSCPWCGAVVLPQNQATHIDWHRLLERIATDVQDLTRAVDMASRVAREQWEATKVVSAAVEKHLRPAYEGRFGWSKEE